MTTINNTALDDRVLEATIGAIELYSIHLGRKLGLYETLDQPITVTGLAARAVINERYAREWLEQQAVAGFVDVDDAGAAWDVRRYSLNDRQRAVFVISEDPAHLSPLADMAAGVGSVLDQVAEAYRTGDGVPYADYGRDFRDGQAAVNRPAFVTDLPDVWLGAVSDVAERLASDGGRVADLGCGEGWSTIAMAGAFPNSEVIGFDSDPGSIDEARRNAKTTEATAQFRAADGATLEAEGPFDLVVILEALHDMANPVNVLAAARRSLAPNGALLVADEKVADNFVAPGDELERFMYGWSVAHCLPAAMAEEGSAAIGTVLRPPMMQAMARDAGFGSVELSDIDAGFFNLYALRP